MASVNSERWTLPGGQQDSLRLSGEHVLATALENGLDDGELAWSAERVPGWGPLFVAATRHGLCRIDLRADLDPTLSFSQAARCAETSAARRDDALLAPFVSRLCDYLESPSTAGLNLPVRVRGSDFQVRTWHALTRIPPGETRTYGELAAALGNPGAARAVGGGCHANPVPFVVPCHRVVASGGSLGGFALGPGMKRRLLAAESGQWTLLENA